MRLKRDLIVLWFLLAFVAGLLPFVFKTTAVGVLLIVGSFTFLLLIVVLQFQRMFFKEIQSRQTWEVTPIRQFKNELFFVLGVGTVSSTLMWALTKTVLVKYFVFEASYHWIVFYSFVWAFCTNFLYHLLFLKQYSLYLKKEATSYKQLSSVTQKKSLQDLVSPHFLFNSLNTAASIIPDDADTADLFVNKLSDLYDFILKNSENQLIELQEELEIVEKYSYLIQTRFGSAFQINIAIPNEYKNVLIPPLTLQNLVENAAKHNAVTRKKPLLLEITVGDGIISVKNNINPKKTFHNESTNLGLSYITSQIAQFSTSKVVVKETDDFFLVEIPLIYPSDL